MCDIYILPMTVLKWNSLMNNKTQSQIFEWTRESRRINKMIHDFKYKSNVQKCTCHCKKLVLVFSKNKLRLYVINIPS